MKLPAEDRQDFIAWADARADITRAWVSAFPNGKECGVAFQAAYQRGEVPAFVITRARRFAVGYTAAGHLIAKKPTMKRLLSLLPVRGPFCPHCGKPWR